MGARAHTEVDVRLRKAELPKEDLGHALVVVLPGMYQSLRYSTVCERTDDGCGLGKVRPGAGHVYD
jgi:hypothetical protein